MSYETIIFFLSICIVCLFTIILYQQFAFRRGTQTCLREITTKLKEILDSDTDEKIMVFTENHELIELTAQINELLENHLKVKVDYRRSEISSRKMLSNISHDIKTPMTVVLGYLEIMRLNGMCTVEMLEKTEKKTQNVIELIDQFFTLTKLESDDMNMELSKIDVCEICRESILNFYEVLTGSGFQVDILLPEKAVYIQGNKNAIERILSNLISNAIRYGSDGKYLCVALRKDEKSVYIDVVDKGKGIDKLFADKIFERLFTMEDSRNRNIQGNGLGLAIAKNLALQLGGTLTLDSTPGIKTTFTVKLKALIY